jgi:hypothetical protein
MLSTYAVWIGHPVILQLVAADSRVPLRGIIVAESDEGRLQQFGWPTMGSRKRKRPLRLRLEINIR